ncbi:hemin uptake protein HemP [Thioalkalivibrio thiocyanodenitrificans]|uniref:hemin uptake protein HemP n=1 Tax=Thioalkalivibrio thiocyanodenitrificans TaxID=243063 RepID=UPI00036DE97A|nr:hemin uptake protein HemP [Thioalkalivibrio thiocyanodenitrificans]
MNKPSSVGPGTAREARESAASPQSPEVLPSHVLLGRRRQVQIEHLGERYTLRVTRHGKLILTK